MSKYLDELVALTEEMGLYDDCIKIGEGCQGEIFFETSEPDVCYKHFYPNIITVKSLIETSELQNRVAELGYAPFAHECFYIGNDTLVLCQDYLKGYKELDPNHPDIDYIIYTVINALKEANVTHNDLFTGNILVNDQLDIKIIDFAMAEHGFEDGFDYESLINDLYNEI